MRSDNRFLVLGVAGGSGGCGRRFCGGTQGAGFPFRGDQGRNSSMLRILFTGTLDKAGAGIGLLAAGLCLLLVHDLAAIRLGSGVAHANSRCRESQAHSHDH